MLNSCPASRCACRSSSCSWREHRHEWLLDLLIQPRELRKAAQLRPERLVQAQRHVGVLSGVLARALHRHLIEADLLGALAGQVGVAERT
jgi:hypothetical protein